MYISLFARARRPRVWFRDPATPRPLPAQGVVGSRNPQAVWVTVPYPFRDMNGIGSPF